MDPLLRFYLFGDCDAWTDYSAFFNDSRIVTTNTCNYVAAVAPVIVENGNTLSTTTIGNLQWYLDGNLLNAETNQSIDASQYGNVTYTVVLTTDLVCELTSNEIDVEGLSVQKWNVTTYSIYPVPASETVYVIMDNFSSDELKVVDLYGKILLTIQPESSTVSIPITEFSPGIYHVISSHGAVGRIVKQ